MSFPIKAHKDAFELFRKRRSMYWVSQQKGMPSVRTLCLWRDDFNCTCGYHNWDSKLNEIASKLKELDTAKEAEKIHTDIEAQTKKYAEDDLETLELLRDFKKRIKAQSKSLTIKDDSLKDATSALSDITKIARLLRGESTENVSNNTTLFDVSNEIQQSIDQKLNELKANVEEINPDNTSGVVDGTTS
jgi:cysteinyl-tRNA synthetase